MIAVGTDIEEIARLRRSMEHPRFLTRVFSSAEIALFESKRMSPATIAGNFCAKEAFAKSLGTGVRGFDLREVSVLRDGAGRPYLELAGRAARIVRARRLRFSVSISHCRAFATAVVVAEEEGTARG